MQLPDGSTLMHGGRPYDSAKAHEYYLRTRKLKGRRKGKGEMIPETGKKSPKPKADPRLGSLESVPAQMQKLLTDRDRKAKIDSIMKKLEKLASAGKGKSDIATRQAAEKQQTANAKQKDVQVIRQEVATLNESLKAKIASKAPKAELESIKADIAKAKKKLTDATTTG